MTPQDVRKAVQTEITVPVWPAYGVITQSGRNATYDAANKGLDKGDPLFIRSGRLIRMVCAVARQRFGI